VKWTLQTIDLRTAPQGETYVWHSNVTSGDCCQGICPDQSNFKVTHTPRSPQHFYGKSFTITFDFENFYQHKMNVYGWPLRQILKGLLYWRRQNYRMIFYRNWWQHWEVTELPTIISTAFTTSMTVYVSIQFFHLPISNGSLIFWDHFSCDMLQPPAHPSTLATNGLHS